MPSKELTETISTYWWNFGTKKNDFNGSIAQYFVDKSFKVSTIKHPFNKETKGYRFKFAVSSISNVMDVFHYSKSDAAVIAIQTFLTHLGDRALINYKGRTIRINH